MNEPFQDKLEEFISIAQREGDLAEDVTEVEFRVRNDNSVMMVDGNDTPEKFVHLIMNGELKLKGFPR